MRTNDTRRLLATIAVSAMIGAVAGLWSASPSTASSAAVSSASYCGGSACTSHTWLWTPAMRRAGR